MELAFRRSREALVSATRLNESASKVLAMLPLDCAWYLAHRQAPVRPSDRSIRAVLETVISLA
jgi:hypothetical protein